MNRKPPSNFSRLLRLIGISHGLGSISVLLIARLTGRA
jgi:hypothetical protein